MWDLYNEKLMRQIRDKEKINGSIVDIKELTHLKLVAIASLDKRVTVWNLERKLCILTIDLTIGGVHHMLYSYNYQLLITVGYENIINIFSINPQYFDCNKEGRLIGHTSMVTAIELVDQTPMMISADDAGCVKLWDVRSMKCLQTFTIGSKSTINKIINIPLEGMVCFLGSRLNLIEFEKANSIFFGIL